MPDNLIDSGIDLNNLAQHVERPAGDSWPISEMLFDLEVPVSVSFGRTRLTLRDLLDLSLDSLIELDRSIHDPVEILANDRVIARGEVVAVDGNYGVRVLEVVDGGRGSASHGDPRAVSELRGTKR
jgi:flagellar motor switch protein FliN